MIWKGGGKQSVKIRRNEKTDVKKKKEGEKKRNVKSSHSLIKRNQTVLDMISSCCHKVGKTDTTLFVLIHDSTVCIHLRTSTMSLTYIKRESQERLL